MTTRNDVTVDFDESPRIAEVASPSTEFIMQDIVDTLRKIEDQFMPGMSHEKLLNASGKEDLGGGVSVGITTALQNTQIAFEARTSPAETGTVTTGSGAPVANSITFVDTAADFVTAGVQRGSMVINFTDQSIADVLEVVNSTTLRTKILVNGSDNSFDIGDSYQVFNVIQCDLSGGNLVAVDDMDNTISPVLPTAFTQIVRTSSSSATLSEQADIQYASFAGGVTIDVTTSNTGTVFPIGTPRLPVNNLSDALSILLSRGFDSFFVRGNLTVSAGTLPYRFVGQAVSITTITLDSAPDLTNARFENATITGTLDGDAALTNCTVSSLNFFNGVINSCVLEGTITLGGAIDALILDSFSDVNGATIDLGGSGQALSLQNFNGDVTLTNKTGADIIEIGMSSGSITIDNTVTAGTITLQGVGKWINRDSYTGGATIIDELLTIEDSQFSSFNGEVTIDAANGFSGVSYPNGTPRRPVDNLADALSIASTRGLNQLNIIGNLTIDADVSDLTVVGQSQSKTSLIITAGANTSGTEFISSTLNGVLDGDNSIFQCALETVSGFDGIIRTSLLKGTLTLSGTNDAFILDCRSGIVGSTKPIIDFNSSGSGLVIRNYNGGIDFRNKSGSENISCDFNSVNIDIQDTVTGGNIDLRGVGVWSNEDTYAGGITVVNELISNEGIISELNSTTYDGKSYSLIVRELLAMANGRIVESSPGVFDFYEQDNATIAFTLTKSGSERTRS